MGEIPFWLAVLIALVAAAVVGLIVFLITRKSTKKSCEKHYEETVGTAEKQARDILEKAEKEAVRTAEATKKEALLQAKEENLQARNDLEREIKERRAEVQSYERRVTAKEENLDRKMEVLEKKEARMNQKEQELDARIAEADSFRERQIQELERISGLTSEIAKKINKSIFPGTQGGPLMHVIAAKAVAFGEALTPEFKAYQHQIVLNAKAMSERFLANGVNLVSGGTDNHLMLLDLTSNHITGKELETLLDEAHITVNKNAIPFDPEKPFVTSGVRIGTPSITQRGMKEADCVYIADLITDVIKNREEALPRVSKAVSELCKKYPIYENDILY